MPISDYGRGGVEVDVHGVMSAFEGSKLLWQRIEKHLQCLRFSSDLKIPDSKICSAISEAIKPEVEKFYRHNWNGTVEVHALVTVTTQRRKGGTATDSLEIIWDADYPLVNSTQDPHYGWEFHSHGARIAGPGHIYLKNPPRSYSRLPGQEITSEPNETPLISSWRFPGLEKVSLETTLKTYEVGKGSLNVSIRWLGNKVQQEAQARSAQRQPTLGFNHQGLALWEDELDGTK